MSAAKKWLSVLAMIVGTGLVCFGSTLEMKIVKTEIDPVETTKFSRGETVYFWYSDEELLDYVNRAAVSFGEQEDVHVLPVLVSPQEYLEQIYDATLRDEQMPDVFLMSNESLERAYLAGLASEIRDEENICSESNFGNGALQSVTYQGKKVGYPFSYETCALVYNDTYLQDWASQLAKRYLVASEDETIESEEELEGDALFAWQQKQLAREQYAQMSEEEQASWVAELAEEYYINCIPNSVEDILNISETYTAPDTLTGIMAWDVNNILYNYWVLGGTTLIGGEAGDDASQIDVNNAAAISALQYYQSLQEAFYIEAESSHYQQVLQDFLDGKLLFIIATTDVVAALDAASTEGTLEFDYGLCTMPNLSADIPGRTVSITSLVAVNGYSVHKDTANAFAQYLVTEAAKDLYDFTGRPSANKNMNVDNGPLSVFELSYEESLPLPKFIETENLWLQLEAMLTRVWQGTEAKEELIKLQLLLERQLGTK